MMKYVINKLLMNITDEKDKLSFYNILLDSTSQNKNKDLK